MDQDPRFTPIARYYLDLSEEERRRAFNVQTDRPGVSHAMDPERSLTVIYRIFYSECPTWFSREPAFTDSYAHFRSFNVV